MNRLSRSTSSAAAALLLAALIAAPLRADRDPAAGSLWRKPSNNERGMFAAHRASMRGDIVTIVVGENAEIATSVSLSTSKQSSVSNDLSRILFDDVLRRNGDHPSPDIPLGPNAHTGNGTLDNSQSLSARLSVQVIDVLPNGNLVLEGVRIISYAGQRYYMLTQGICRPQDVASDNTVLSSEVADARIEFVAEGSLTDAQKQGWLTRGLNRITP